MNYKRGVFTIENLIIKNELEKDTLLLSLMDSFTNSTNLMDAERDILARIYHRIKGEENLIYSEDQ